MVGVSTSLLLITGAIEGLAHAILVAPIASVQQLTAMIKAAISLAERPPETASQNVPGVMLAARLQPTLLQKAGELIRSVEVGVGGAEKA